MEKEAAIGACLGAIRTSKLRGRAFRDYAVQELDRLDRYDWSGIYRLEGDLLHLDAFVGAATDHTMIPVGTGVCGTAVAENANQVVKDVRDLENYLSCSLQTRSEIVVLVRREKTVLAQIDIDSHTPAAFDETDEKFLEAVAAQIAQRWED